MAEKYEYVGSICLKFSDHYGTISIEIDDSRSSLDPEEARDLAKKLNEIAGIAERAPARVR